ncbi:hypothetical protein KR018_011163, partial [Drosophila ironensis]
WVGLEAGGGGGPRPGAGAGAGRHNVAALAQLDGHEQHVGQGGRQEVHLDLRRPQEPDRQAGDTQVGAQHWLRHRRNTQS